MSVDASEARKHLSSLIEQVNNDRLPVVITSPHGNAVLIAQNDYDAMTETHYLLPSPENARQLMESLEQARRGEREEHELIE